MTLPPDILSVNTREGWLLFSMFTAKFTNFNYYFSIFFSYLLYFTVAVPTIDLTVNLYVQLEQGFTIGALVYWWYLFTLQLAVVCHRYIISEELSTVNNSNSINAFSNAIANNNDNTMRVKNNRWSVDSYDDSMFHDTASTADGANAISSKLAQNEPQSMNSNIINKDESEMLINHKYSVSAFLLPISYFPDSLQSYSYKQSLLIKLTLFGKICVLSLPCLVFGFLLAGMYINTFTYEWVGLVSLGITTDTVSDYSFISIGTGFPATTGYPNQTDVKFAQTVFMLYTIVLPLISVVFMTVLWVVPMKYVTQMCALIVTEFFITWSQFDVAVVTLLVLVTTTTFSKVRICLFIFYFVPL